MKTVRISAIAISREGLAIRIEYESTPESMISHRRFGRLCDSLQFLRWAQPLQSVTELAAAP
jgi:hypothetical protein